MEGGLSRLSHIPPPKNGGMIGSPQADNGCFLVIGYALRRTQSDFRTSVPAGSHPEYPFSPDHTCTAIPFSSCPTEVTCKPRTRSAASCVLLSHIIISHNPDFTLFIYVPHDPRDAVLEWYVCQHVDGPFMTCPTRISFFIWVENSRNHSSRTFPRLLNVAFFLYFGINCIKL